MAELTRRYVVTRLATDAPFDANDPEGPFVLKPWKDPAALAALRAYCDHCYPELRRDLDAWIRVIETGRVVRGDVGRRNERHVTPAGARAADAGAERPGGSGRGARPSARGSRRAAGRDKPRKRR
jgi:hypothetical protein